MVVWCFDREVCFYCNSNSVRQNKQQYFQWPVPQFALFSVCGIWGDRRKAQAAEGKIPEGIELLCVHPGSCCGVLNQICSTVISTASPWCESEPVRTELFHNRGNTVWKLLWTSGDLMWTAEKAVCRRLNINFWKNGRAILFSLLF